jgi:GABA(A) receptor-associated protein
MTFQQSLDFESRLEESKRICAKFPDRIPVVVERSKSSPTLQQVHNPKFLAPKELTVGKFMFIIKRRLKMNSEQSLYLLAKDTFLINSSSLLCSVFDQHKDKDGFLYITYSVENTFG